MGFSERTGTTRRLATRVDDLGRLTDGARRDRPHRHRRPRLGRTDLARVGGTAPGPAAGCDLDEHRRAPAGRFTGAEPDPARPFPTGTRPGHHLDDRVHTRRVRTVGRTPRCGGSCRVPRAVPDVGPSGRDRRLRRRHPARGRPPECGDPRRHRGRPGRLRSRSRSCCSGVLPTRCSPTSTCMISRRASPMPTCTATRRLVISSPRTPTVSTLPSPGSTSSTANRCAHAPTAGISRFDRVCSTSPSRPRRGRRSRRCPGSSVRSTRPSSRRWSPRPPAVSTGAGIRPGDRVALMIPPGIDLSVTLMACWRAGAVAVLVDSGLGPRGMSAAMKSADPTHLIGIPKALVAARALRWPGRRIAVDSIGTPTRRIAGVDTDLPAMRSAPSAPPGPASADDIAAVAFTSGSTGPSKGVIYTHGQSGGTAGCDRVAVRHHVGRPTRRRVRPVRALRTAARHPLGGARHGRRRAPHPHRCGTG